MAESDSRESDWDRHRVFIGARDGGQASGPKSGGLSTLNIGLLVALVVVVVALAGTIIYTIKYRRKKVSALFGKDNGCSNALEEQRPLQDVARIGRLQGLRGGNYNGRQRDEFDDDSSDDEEDMKKSPVELGPLHHTPFLHYKKYEVQFGNATSTAAATIGSHHTNDTRPPPRHDSSANSNGSLLSNAAVMSHSGTPKTERLDSNSSIPSNSAALSHPNTPQASSSLDHFASTAAATLGSHDTHASQPLTSTTHSDSTFPSNEAMISHSSLPFVKSPSPLASPPVITSFGGEHSAPPYPGDLPSPGRNLLPSNSSALSSPQILRGPSPLSMAALKHQMYNVHQSDQSHLPYPGEASPSSPLSRSMTSFSTSYSSPMVSETLAHTPMITTPQSLPAANSGINRFKSCAVEVVPAPAPPVGTHNDSTVVQLPKPSTATPSHSENP